MPLRLIFMGTPDFSVPLLLELAGRGHDIAAVYTRAAKPGGRRGLELVPSPVEREAKKLGLEVRTPASLRNAEAQAEFAALKADAAIVVAYGLILPKPILDARALSALERVTLQLTPQPEAGVTYAAKIDKAETRIDWSNPWKQVHDHIRGLSPFPGAWCELSGERIKVLRSTRGEGSGAPGAVLDDRLTVACGNGAVRIVELQKAGGKAMKAEDFLRGTPVPGGIALG